MADNDKSSAFGRFQSRQAGGEQADQGDDTAKNQTAKSADNVIPLNVEPAFFDPNDLTRVPGAVGQIVDWIQERAIYPSAWLALGPALATVGTLAAHRVMGPTGVATHTFVAVLAPTGEGKNDPLKATKLLFHSIGAGHLIGADDFRSSVGFINELKYRPVFCALMDEFGDFLGRIAHPTAGNYETDVIGVMKKVFALSYSTYHTPAAARDKSIGIFAPSPSVVGFSTAEDFYRALREKQVSGGFLNRFLILNPQQRTVFNPNHARIWELPLSLKLTLKALYKPRDEFKDLLDADMETISQRVGTIFQPEIVMDWGPGAEAIFRELALSCKEQPERLRHDIFIRVAEITIRIATIVAFGRGSWTVEAPDMQWAKALVWQSMEMLYAGVRKYLVDPQDFAARCQRVEEYIKEGKDWTVEARAIKRKFTNMMKKGTNIKEVLTHLEEAECIRQWSAPTGGRWLALVKWIGD
jgi:hypothetical protein